MSEIPYVNRLGNAIEAAIDPAFTPAARRRRRRRGGLVIALAALVTLGGGVAVAGILSDPAELASHPIGCYEGPGAGGNSVGARTEERSPVEACAQVRRTLGLPARALVACDSGLGAIAVFPARGADACARAGLKPLPARYPPEQERVNRLKRDILALESAADCVAPRDLAASVQALLRRSGWTGWRPWLRLDLGTGPCGSVSGLGGDGVRSIDDLDYPGRRILVTASPYRSTVEYLHDASNGIGAPLMDATGKRCYSLDDIRELVGRRLAGTGRSMQIKLERPDPRSRFVGPRQGRLEAGCAVLVDVSAAGDGLGVAVHVWQRG